ncbi:lysozyme g-like [Melanotaenia boesemani]|uniref:lysozyme g-like n=1 Tax=Melanotaenia boesemani TaxID=1250792 RepID=UPI001C04931A|nr:lysozyme g-like [Melanotaenia boesemani]
MMAGASSSSAFTEYGDIKNVKTEGASVNTAKQDGLDKRGYEGVKVSHTMAEMDEERMKVYKDDILVVAKEYKIHPALIAAIISRESRAGNTLKDGWGDNGKAWGLMQVDITQDGGGHKPEGDWNSQTHLKQATGILVYFIKRIQDKFPQWSKEMQLKGGIAAYNQGDKRVESYEAVDANTTAQDYSNDVVARAHCYIKKGFFK